MKICSAHNFHDNLVAHEEEIAKMDNAYNFNGICHEYLKNPDNYDTLYENMNFVRPEDIKKYESVFETDETARKILDNIYFYPGAGHGYKCSICGRACDVDCYVHPEEKGVLKKKFKTPFRKREKWEFDYESFR